MKVLALLTDGFGAPGGIAQYNRDLVAALASLSVVASVRIVPRYGVATAPLPARVEQDAAVPGRVAYALRALRNALESRPDVIFCGHLYMAPLAWLLARLLRRPFWLQLHGIEAWGAQQRSALSMAPLPSAARWAASRADFVTAVSRYTRRQFLSWSAVTPSKVRVLPNTVDTAFKIGTQREDLVERFGLRGKKVLLTVGRMSAAERYKGHDQVLQALPKLAAQFQNLRYLVVGAGDDCGRIEALAARLGLSGLVVFAGEVADADLPDVYRLADAFAMASAGEGFGLVYLQAQATGLPVVASGAGGSVDALADGALGTLIEAQDVAALAQALAGALHRGPQPGEVPLRWAWSNFVQHVSALLRELPRTA